MELVPLISIKDGKLLSGKNGGPLSIDDLFKRVEKDTMLYVLDLFTRAPTGNRSSQK